MFNQNKSALKVGDFVTVGCRVNDRFMPAKYGTRVKVERIFQESDGNIRIDLDWGGFGKSKVYMNDENKYWFKLSNYN